MWFCRFGCLCLVVCVLLLSSFVLFGFVCYFGGYIAGWLLVLVAGAGWLYYGLCSNAGWWVFVVKLVAAHVFMFSGWFYRGWFADWWVAVLSLLIVWIASVG